MGVLPIVDLGAPDVVERLDRACADVGFFALVGHGFDDADGQAVIDAAKVVLSADADEIARLDVATDPNFRGFERAGDRLAFEIGRERSRHGPAILSGPNRWPEVEGVDAARAILEEHHRRCTDVCDVVVGHLVDAGALGSVVGAGPLTGGPTHLRVWRYPPGEIDLPAHADHGFLTLLLAPDPGLEIRRADGVFVAAPPAAGEVLLVNVGRLLASVSGGRYRATVHRVRSSGTRERFSAPFFHAPFDDLAIAPPAQGDSRPRTVADYVQWGYTWQREVNAGSSVVDATDGQVEH